METQSKKRIEITVDYHLVAHIHSCLLSAGACEDFAVSPVLSGWTTKGYWSGDHAFNRIGKKVAVRFTGDARLVDSLRSHGFGLLAMSLIPIGETTVRAA